VTDCTKDIEVISKMYLVHFINPAKSLVAIHAVMSHKFGFACNDGDAPGVHSGRDKRMYQSEQTSLWYEVTSKKLLIAMRSTVDNVGNI